MNRVTVRASAKVNLRLSVGPPRADGYHDVVNVLHAVSLFDEVTATPAAELRIVLDGGYPGQIPTGADNLAARAARALAAHTGTDPGVTLRIRKRIPVAGGMAGGSADAAAALVACDALWGTGLARADLLGLAGGLGSDVPFALLGGTAVGHGRGDRLTPVPTHVRLPWVFGLADGGLSTPAVYTEYDRLRADAPPPSADDELSRALACGDPGVVGKLLANDLQDAALGLRPDLARTLDVGRRAGALGALVSGSGPTCAFLAESAEHADRLHAALTASGRCRAVVRADGPAPGATIV